MKRSSSFVVARAAAAALAVTMFVEQGGCSSQGASGVTVAADAGIVVNLPAASSLVRDHEDLVSAPGVRPFRLRFSREGAVVRATGDQVMILRAVGFGRAGSLGPLAPLGSPRLQGSRASYTRGTVEEWFEPKRDGLEQGFTIDAPPPGDGGLVLDVDVGDLEATTSTDPNSAGAIDLRQPGETASALRYGALAAEDRNGRSLPATIGVVATHTLRIEVDDRGAAYPITIDPMLWVVAETVTPDARSPGEQFGFAVSLRGDTLVASAPERGGGHGGATVFRREGTTWVEEAALAPPGPDPGLQAGTSLDFDGERVILGSEQPAFVYARSGKTWSLEQVLEAPWLNQPGIGVRVAIRGSRAALLVPSLDALTGEDGTVEHWDPSMGAPPASVFLYEKDAAGWSLKRQLPLPTVSNPFGLGRVVLGDDRVVSSLAGVVVVYTRAADDTWAVEAVLQGASYSRLRDYFGADIALSGDTLLVSDTLAVHAFVRVGGTWSPTGTLVEPFVALTVPLFGCGMAVEGDVAFIGDPATTVVLRFRRFGQQWTLEQVFNHRFLAANFPIYGTNIAVSADAVAFGDPKQASFRGSVSLYTLKSSLGDACNDAQTCASGFCVDGVCCDSACGNGGTQDCMTCARPQALGACGPASTSTVCRPAAGGCDVAETCDGVLLTCPADLREPNGTTCADGICVAGECTRPTTASPTPEASAPPAAGEKPAELGCSAAGVRAPSDSVAMTAALVLLAAILARRRSRWLTWTALGAAASGTFGLEVPPRSLEIASEDTRLHARFDAEGPRFFDDGMGSSWGVSLVGFGRGSSIGNVDRAEPVRKGDRVVYERRGLVEWYEAKATSIEQGFDVVRRLPGEGPLVVRLSFSGAVERRDDDEVAVTVAGMAGRFGYGELVAVDARGERLPSRLEAAGGALEIRVDDAGAVYPVVIDPSIWREHQRLAPKVPYLSGLASDGATLAVRHRMIPPTGIEIFQRTGSRWTPDGSLVPVRFVEEYEQFGYSMSVSGDTIAAGAIVSSVTGLYTGSVFLFERISGTWLFETEIAADDVTTQDEFGWSVALEGDTLVVGADQNRRFSDAARTVDRLFDPTEPVGAAYVYTRVEGAWSLSTKLMAAPSVILFGSQVVLSGSTLMVSAITRSQPYTVVIFVYERVGSEWQLRSTIEDPVQAPVTSGGTIALDGDTAVFFGPEAHVYHRNGDLWTPGSVLPASDPDHLYFMSGAIRGTRITAGSPFANGATGALYVFDRDAQGAWSQSARLEASDGNTDHLFGTVLTMATADEVLAMPAAGSPDGAVYDFRLGPAAIACTSADDCPAASYCVDAFCCDRPCGGSDPNDCQACSVAAGAAADGVCGPVSPRVCRPARDACDVDDRCDGTNLVCPADVVAENGHTCPGGVCHAGRCGQPLALTSTDGAAPSEPDEPLDFATDGSCSCRAAGASGRAMPALMTFGAGALLLLRRSRRSRRSSGA